MRARMLFRFTLILQVLLLATIPLFAQQISGTTPIFIGQWDPVFDWPVVAIHAHVMPDGRVVTWERNDAILKTDAYIWNAADNSNVLLPRNEVNNLFCSGHTFLKDGTLFMAGGHVYDDHHGDTRLVAFNGTSFREAGPMMNAGRWYPTTTMLKNGGVLILGGNDLNSSDPNTLPQVYYKIDQWSSSLMNLNNANREVPLYPMVFPAPDGRAFMAGPEAQSAFLTATGDGAWQNGPVSSGGYRDAGSAVEYQPGKILLVGGGAPTATAEKIDLNAATPVWTSAGSMGWPRRHLNATILPDGTVLVTGGTSSGGFNNASGAVYASELWDPASGAWSTVAAQQQKRLYHSTAVLLKDGRVLSMGGGLPAAGGETTNYRDAQIYSPAYLFRGYRPTITSAPTNITYNQTFTIQTPEASSIASVTMVRLSSVTHSFNMSQRFNRMTPTIGSGEVTVTAPANSQITPGPYWLFLLNSSGIPSIGKLVYIQ